MRKARDLIVLALIAIPAVVWINLEPYYRHYKTQRARGRGRRDSLTLTIRRFRERWKEHGHT
jgi:hypothetical protein